MDALGHKEQVISRGLRAPGLKAGLPSPWQEVDTESHWVKLGCRREDAQSRGSPHVLLGTPPPPHTHQYPKDGGNIFVQTSSLGFPDGSAGKESACNAGDLSSIPGLGRSPREGNGYSLQYSGLEDATDYTVHGWQRVGHN